MRVLNGQSSVGCSSSALPNVTGTVAKCVSSFRIQELVWGQIGSSAHRATLNKCFNVCRDKTVSTELSRLSAMLCRSASLFHQDLVREKGEREREKETGVGDIVPSVGSCSVLDLGHIPMSV